MSNPMSDLGVLPFSVVGNHAIRTNSCWAATKIIILLLR